MTRLHNNFADSSYNRTAVQELPARGLRWRPARSAVLWRYEWSSTRSLFTFLSGRSQLILIDLTLPIEFRNTGDFRSNDNFLMKCTRRCFNRETGKGAGSSA